MSVRGFNTGSGIEQYDYDYLDNKPDAPTKESIGLGNVDNTSDMNKPVSTLQAQALSQKVDKVPGMGLSSEDFTSADKEKLEALPTNEELEAELEGKASTESVTSLNQAITVGNLNQYCTVNPASTGNNIGEWNSNRSTLQILENGSIKVTKNVTNATTFGLWCYFQPRTDYEDLTGHKIYVRIQGIDTTNCPTYKKASGNLSFNGSGTTGTGFDSTDSTIERILTATTAANQFTILFHTAATADAGEVTVEGFQFIDLTEMFGAGYEPTLEEFKAVYTEDLYPQTIPTMTVDVHPDKILANKISAAEERTNEVALEKSDVIIDTKDGNIALIHDGADAAPIRSLVANIEPVQDLHGYDHPWAAGCGKNKIKITGATISDGEVTINGVTFTPAMNDAGDIISITANGTASARSTLILVNRLASQLASGDYIISGCPSGGSWNTYCLTSWDSTVSATIGNDVGSGVTITFDDTHIVNFAIDIKSSVTVSNLVFQPMIRLATETDASFAPYSNECPITGWTGLSGKRTGKNLLNGSEYSWSTSKGITFTYNADGSVTMNGTASDNAFSQNLIRYRLKPGKYIKTPIEPHVYTCAQYVKTEASWATFPGGNGNSNVFIVTEETAKYDARFRIVVDAGTTLDNYTFYPYCYVDGETDLTGEPYTGTDISVNWETEAGTVYGGTVDVISGKMIVDRVTHSLTGTEGFSTIAHGETSSRYASYINMPSSPSINLGWEQCVPIPNNSANYSQAASSHFLYRPSHHAFGTFMINADRSLAFYDEGDRFENAAAFKAWLAEQYNNGTPVQISYLIETPIEYQLTPQQITTFLGENRIWADTGDVTVEYPADTKLYIQQLTRPTEDDMTANANIAINKFFMLGNTLYFSTAAIAQGETIVPGTNCNIVSLADALNQLNT